MYKLICAADGEFDKNVVIFPGGGYEWLSPREGMPVAHAFEKAGIRPFIITYTVSENGEVLGLTPLKEAAGAVREVKKLFPGQPVIVCGFSAGSHAAADLGVHWNDENVFSRDEITANRPDAMILSYPVITAGKYAHRGSIEALVGKCIEGEEEKWLKKAEYFSLENYVSDSTPPAFIWHTSNDRSVPVQNSLLFAKALADNNVRFELHIYPEGTHGLSLATQEVAEPEKDRYPDSHVAEWFNDCIIWIERMFAKS